MSLVRFRSVVEVGLVSRESRVLSLYKEMVVMTETKKAQTGAGRARRGRATFPFFENFRLPINSARGATFFRSKVSMTMIVRSTRLDLQYHSVQEHEHGHRCIERRCRSKRRGVGPPKLPQTGIGSGSLLQGLRRRSFVSSGTPQRQFVRDGRAAGLKHALAAH